MRCALLLLVPFASLAMAAFASDDVSGEQRRVGPEEPFVDSVAVIEAMTEAELKRFYLRCSRASLRGRISTGDIQICSLGYERLLQHSFGGDFRALLEWRREAVRQGDPT